MIVLAEQTHNVFSRKGDNLIYNMKLTLSEALCGFDKVIKHLDGRDIVISRPMGQTMEPNGLYIIEGEGMPKSKDPYSKGDLYVTCDIEFPERIEDSEVRKSILSYLLLAFDCEFVLKKLEKLLPARPTYSIPEDDDDVEDVDMMDYQMETTAGATAADSDSDDEAGGPRVQQCATA